MNIIKYLLLIVQIIFFNPFILNAQLKVDALQSFAFSNLDYEKEIRQDIQKNEWAPIGAEWHYDYELELPFKNHGYTLYKVLKDTIINSQTARLIYKQDVYFNGGIAKKDTLYTYEEDSKVYFLINDKFSLAYDFGAQVGDTIRIDPDFFNCDSISPIVVDSIKSMVVNGIQLKRQFVSYKLLKKGKNNQVITDIFTEKFGNYGNLIFHPNCGGDTFVYPFLRCYQDNLLSYVNDYWKSLYPNASCDTLIYTGIANIKSNLMVRIYPNPTDGIIYIDSKDKISTLTIYDSKGSIVKSNWNKTLSNADISNLRNGLYIIKITFMNGESSNYKVLKK